MTLPSRTVLLLGATGTIGQATARTLHQAGHRVIAPVRAKADSSTLPHAVPSDFTEASFADLIAENGCDSVVSCVASRSGSPSEARAIDHRLNSAALRAALDAGVDRFVLLSAICVQRPKLAFQHAKLAFEAELQAAPITWSIVRPTAYFKSLSGQIDRLRAGKPFLVFGNGEGTACKPISDDDLAQYLMRCLSDPDLQNRILPIGGPGPAITPLQQGSMLFDALGLEPKFKHVPLGLMSAIISGLSVAGTVIPPLRDKAELARIGRYYATESMLVWNEAKGAYDAAGTPEFGTETLGEHYARLVAKGASDDLGAHSVF